MFYLSEVVSCCYSGKIQSRLPSLTHSPFNSLTLLHCELQVLHETITSRTITARYQALSQITPIGAAKNFRG